MKKDCPFESLKDPVDTAKAKPNTGMVSTAGVGGINHLDLMALERQSGAVFDLVHFTGAAPATNALRIRHRMAAWAEMAEQVRPPLASSRHCC